MLRLLTQASLRHPGLALLFALVLVVAGLRAWLQLPIDAFPDISPTQAKIVLKAPGMTPEEVELRVVRPIEQELLSIPRKRMVRSVSKYGIADITLDFEEGVDIYWARQQVNERLSGVLADLPASVSGGLAPITTPLSELYMFTIEGDAHSLAERRRVLDWVIRPALRTVPGVAELNALGGEVQTFEVTPDAPRMAAMGLGLDTLRETLMRNNSNDGAGRIISGEEAEVVRVEGSVRSLDDLRAIRLPLPRGGTVLLEDVATVRLGALTRYGAVTQDGRGETVQGLVLGLRGADARQLVQNVAKKLDEVAAQLPPGMTIHTFYNRGDLVDRASNTVIKALAEAAVLVCVVLYFFLGGVRAAVVVALSLPLTLLATFLLMRWTGLSANLMSLGGLAIALGMLVDSSVVVVENIESQDEGTDPAQSRSARILAAVQQVAQPVFSGILIIAVVFLPLLTLEGLEGKLFRPVALSIVMALGASLLVAFTVIPVLAGLLLKPGAGHEPALMRRISAAYVRLRDSAWRHPRWLNGLALASLVLAGGLYAIVGKTFMPTLDEGDVLVQLQKAPSISLEASLELDTRVQQAIHAQVPEVQAIVARTGSDELGLDPMGLNETDTFLVLKPRDQWRGDKQAIIESLRQTLDGFPGLVYGFTQPIEMRVSEMLTGTRGDVAIKLFGNDLDQLVQSAQRIAKAVREVPGAAEVIAPRSEGMPYLSITLDRHAIGQAGRSVEDIQLALRQQVEGLTVGVVHRDGMRTPLVLRGDERLRHSPETLRNLQLAGADGRSWRVSSLAEIRQTDGPIRIDHEQGSRLATLQISVEGRDLTGFVEEAQRAVAALGLPPEVRVVWGGQFENQQRAAARLGLVIPVALGLIFLILTLTFGSPLQAMIIFLNIPFALVGGMVALAIAGEYLSVPASVGFIALLGIAVLNGVVMVSHFNERRAHGEPLDQVVRRGSERRLRPVLMTAIIAALGMIPLLFATGPGSEIQRPLAVVVSGGLVSSTLLTLLLLPRIYERLMGLPPDALRRFLRSGLSAFRGEPS
jgi:CzcA family heavy metal efflux pump